MELKHDIDSDIQRGLRTNGIKFPVDGRGRIAISELRMDTKAKSGMLYIIPENNLPKVELPFLVVQAQWVYGVFHYDGEAAIIEIGERALSGDIVDYHTQTI
jgi:hypothetical protein